MGNYDDSRRLRQQTRETNARVTPRYGLHLRAQQRNSIT
jgi:hypothetical protein